MGFFFNKKPTMTPEMLCEVVIDQAITDELIGNWFNVVQSESKSSFRESFILNSYLAQFSLIAFFCDDDKRLFEQIAIGCYARIFAVSDKIGVDIDLVKSRFDLYQELMKNIANDTDESLRMCSKAFFNLSENIYNPSMSMKMFNEVFFYTKDFFNRMLKDICSKVKIVY